MDPWITSVVFLLAGILFAVLELFLPSGGVLAFFSFASFCTSVVFAFHQGVEFGLGFTCVLMVGLPIMVWQMIVIWPKTPFGKRMMLDPNDDPALIPDAEDEVLAKLVGKTGTAKSRMMPSGVVVIEKRQYDAVSESEPIDPGSYVIVIKANKLNVIVRQIAPDTGLPASISGYIDSTNNECKINDPFGDQN